MKRSTFINISVARLVVARSHETKRRKNERGKKDEMKMNRIQDLSDFLYFFFFAFFVRIEKIFF